LDILNTLKIKENPRPEMKKRYPEEKESDWPISCLVGPDERLFKFQNLLSTVYFKIFKAVVFKSQISIFSQWGACMKNRFCYFIDYSQDKQ
jgi:hypothetical protein